MVTILATALAAMTFLCVVLGWTCYRFYVRGAIRKADQSEWRLIEMKDKECAERYLRGMQEVMNRTVGGITYNISHNIQVAEALYAHAPEVFKKNTSLAYNLHALDQFLVSLRAAGGDGLDDQHMKWVIEWQSSGPNEIFSRIYAGAGLPPPPILQYPTEVWGAPVSNPAAEDGLRTGFPQVI